MPEKHLTPEQRHEIALAVLSGMKPADVAEKWPVSRQHANTLAKQARRDVAEELPFWERVAALVQNGG